MEALKDDSRVAHNIAANVKWLLAAKVWTQKDLAELTGDPPMTISNVCNAKCVTNGGVLARIAAALDVSIDSLVSDPPTVQTVPAGK